MPPDPTSPAAGDGPRLLPLVAALCGFAIPLVLSAAVLNDGDTYWHIAAGDWMLAHHAVPLVDPFSFTFAGRPWVAHEWLSELLMALAYRLGNWPGVLMLFGGALALTFGMLARHLARWVGGSATAISLVIGAGCVGPMVLARPHILALPVMELWAAGLLIARSRRRAPSFWLLPLMVLWANLHGSFILGLALTAPLALEAVVEAAPNRAAAVRGWGLFGVAAVALSLATPHGLDGLLFPIQLMRMHSLTKINEWQPTSFGGYAPIELALMALLYVTMTREIRVPPLRILVLLGILHLALSHSRHQSLVGVVGTLALAEAIGHDAPALPRAAIGDGARFRLPRRAWPLGALSVALAMAVIRAVIPLERTDGATSPIAALDHVPASLAAMPVFNDYGFGGYLIFRGVRPFIDGRADLYGDDFLTDYTDAAQSKDKLAALLAAHGIKWSILTAGSPTVALLGDLGWRRLYADATAVVQVPPGP